MLKYLVMCLVFLRAIKSCIPRIAIPLGTHLLNKIGNSLLITENRCRETDSGAYQLGQWPGVSHVLHIGIRGIGQCLEVSIHGL